MPLEAVMVCMDNSDFTRNGDYAPTRFESQTDAVNLVCGAKTQQNPENSVGLLATAGDRIEVLITPTTDLGKIISVLPQVNIGGASDMLRGIQTAQLALKHRQNKNQKQRIIAFVGSPIGASDKELETLGKNLKKNNVSLDLVSFGEVEENAGKLQKLLGAVNSNETSHVVEVPVGPKLLSDVLLSSPIISDGEGGGFGGGGGGGEGFEFGINPTEDPELALALRISMEEERARQQASGAAPAENDGAAAPAPAEGGAAPAASAPAVAPAAPAAAVAGGALPQASDAAVMEAMGIDDMDEELRQALLLSLQETEPAAPPAPAAAPAATPAVTPAAPAAPAAATTPAPPAQGSTAPAAAPSAGAGAAGGGEEGVDATWFQDPDFVSDLLGSLPGVDINDPRIQNALKTVSEDPQKKDEKKEGDGSGGSKDGK